MDVRKEVENTFHDNEVHELVKSPLLRGFVHFDRLPCKLGDCQRAHHQTMKELNNVTSLIQTERIRH